jgi:hypothetical protein
VRVPFFRTDASRLDSTPSAEWSWFLPGDSTKQAILADMLAADLDRDGDDELICAISSIGSDRHGELWIYDGGPLFQVGRPTTVIRDSAINEYLFRAVAGDIDGDRKIDLITIVPVGTRTTMNIYRGSNDLMSPGRQPDRTVDIGNPTVDLAQFSWLADVDGDSVKDLVRPGLYIWRSGSGKDPYLRTWSEEDADNRLWKVQGAMASIVRPGYLNSKRYEMVGGRWEFRTYLFSGGAEGPDNRYDATFDPRLDSNRALGVYVPAGDVNGDGWDDALDAGPDYLSWAREWGRVIIVAGGPHIPLDDPASSVRRIDLEETRNALSLWPNPVRTELNIAWRGDLEQMPRRFEVHDMLGRSIADGTVSDGEGAAIWRTVDLPSGSYLLSIYDASGELLASVPFTRE